MPWRRLRNAGPLDEIVLLPLYPHYSYATTLSSLKEWRRIADQAKWGTANREAAGNAPSTIFTTILSIFRRSSNGLDRCCGNSRIVSRIQLVFRRAWPSDEPGRKRRSLSETN